MNQRRCFGVDWLEMFVRENPRWDYSPEGFRARGWDVRERDYGTKTMAQMFVLLDQRGHDFIEIRREPRAVGDRSHKTVYESGDSYVRLSNMYCYDESPMSLIERFLSTNRYFIKKIYRIDLFIDLDRFDGGDLPRKVARRIVNHTYAKINQTRRRCAGEDTWTECFDNWISWGNPKSMVSTKFYCKVEELRANGMAKPWIVEKWRQDGLVDDVVGLTKDGHEADIWRLEFSIKGNAKGWIWIEGNDAPDAARYHLDHTQLLYSTPKGVLNAIANLIPYYFRFKIYEEGRRKSLCDDKFLFRFDEDNVELGYRLTSSSDFGRVRSVQVEDDIIARRYLDKACMKLIGTKYERPLMDMINSLTDRISEKHTKTFSQKTDSGIF